LQMFLLPCIFFSLAQSLISPHSSLQMFMGEVILNLVPRRKKNRGGRTSAVEESSLQNYSVREGGGWVREMQWRGSIPFYRMSYRDVDLAMAAIVILAENRWQQ
jgi:hypothetical protein